MARSNSIGADSPVELPSMTRLGSRQEHITEQIIA
ncbi:hypothetical protein BDD21_0620 [Thiocapsa rosea]|uniref:Uncharacterized protein n=1 Tax=Thiocapsa rosea TaxID=69360 RepID=A0A495V1L0_9GAMM|nr:hypothetical protein BDD21_0620 [Thiocapsa rosea]